MKRLIFPLLLLSNIPLAEAVSGWTCDFPKIQIPTSPLDFGSRDSQLPRVISKDWHENRGTAVRCTNYPTGADFITFIDSTPSSSGNLNLGGVDYRIFETGVDGIGMIMEAGDINGDYKAFNSSNPTSVSAWSSNTNQALPIAGMKFRIKYVATKHLAPGLIQIPPKQVMRAGISVGNGNTGVQGGDYIRGGEIVTSQASLTVKYPSCDVITPNAPVKLPQIYKGKVNTVSATAGETGFRITLDCKAGSVDQHVRYTLTDISNPNNTTSTLGLSSNSTAKGVALQVLENTALVKFGPDSSVAGNTNQRDFGLMSRDGGRLDKDLVVRYLRTDAPQLTPGTVKAGITVTMSYQ